MRQARLITSGPDRTDCFSVGLRELLPVFSYFIKVLPIWFLRFLISSERECKPRQAQRFNSG